MACHYKPYHLHYAQKGVVHSLEQTKSALLIVNVQKAFLPGGHIGIQQDRSNARDLSMRMINTINALIESNKFDHHIYVQDAHHPDHVAFAGDREPFSVVELNYDDTHYKQLLWPAHCRIDGLDAASQSLTDNSMTASGIELAEELINPSHPSYSAKSKVFTVGEDHDIDSFSAFKNYLGRDTGLHKCLLQLGVKHVYVCGLARDFAGWWATVDAVSYVDPQTMDSIFTSTMIWDATLPAPGSTELAEYDPKTVSETGNQAPHHKALEIALSKPNCTIESIFNALNNISPQYNRWVQCYLNSYGAQAVSATDILDGAIDVNTQVVTVVTQTVNDNENDAGQSGQSGPSGESNQMAELEKMFSNFKTSAASAISTVLPDTEESGQTETDKPSSTPSVASTRANGSNNDMFSMDFLKGIHREVQEVTRNAVSSILPSDTDATTATTNAETEQPVKIITRR